MTTATLVLSVPLSQSLVPLRPLMSLSLSQIPSLHQHLVHFLLSMVHCLRLGFLIVFFKHFLV